MPTIAEFFHRDSLLIKPEADSDSRQTFEDARFAQFKIALATTHSHCEYP